jgi:hypothetical protein
VVAKRELPRTGLRKTRCTGKESLIQSSFQRAVPTGPVPVERMIGHYGTVPIFVSAKMGLSPFPGDTAPMASLTRKSIQARHYSREDFAPASPPALCRWSERSSAAAQGTITLLPSAAASSLRNSAVVG